MEIAGRGPHRHRPVHNRSHRAADGSWDRAGTGSFTVTTQRPPRTLATRGVATLNGRLGTRSPCATVLIQPCRPVAPLSGVAPRARGTRPHRNHGRWPRRPCRCRPRHRAYTSWSLSSVRYTCFALVSRLPATRLAAGSRRCLEGGLRRMQRSPALPERAAGTSRLRVEGIPEGHCRSPILSGCRSQRGGSGRRRGCVSVMNITTSTPETPISPALVQKVAERPKTSATPPRTSGPTA